MQLIGRIYACSLAPLGLAARRTFTLQCEFETLQERQDVEGQRVVHQRLYANLHHPGICIDIVDLCNDQRQWHRKLLLRRKPHRYERRCPLLGNRLLDGHCQWNRPHDSRYWTHWSKYSRLDMSLQDAISPYVESKSYRHRCSCSFLWSYRLCYLLLPTQCTRCQGSCMPSYPTQ